MAYVDYMDLAVHCSRKAVKLDHSLTHSPLGQAAALTTQFYIILLPPAR